MLNEKIESCSEIADLEGLYFVWENLSNGVCSIDSLTSLRLHHKGKINVNIDYTILLFEQLKIVDISNDLVSISKMREDYPVLDKNSYSKWISRILIDYLLDEKVISSEGIRYNSQIDGYILPRHNIKLKYACYRNLLISLDLLEKYNDGNFLINELVASYLIKEKKKRLKISEEELLKRLEKQRIQGEKGELFVLGYEKNRLSKRLDLDRIKRISVIDVSAGYDIISFRNNKSIELDCFIEVKTYKGKPHFHWSSNEIQIAKRKSRSYFLYLVDIDKYSDPLYEPIIISDPISYFDETTEWISSPESFLFEKIG